MVKILYTDGLVRFLFARSNILLIAIFTNVLLFFPGYYGYRIGILKLSLLSIVCFTPLLFLLLILYIFSFVHLFSRNRRIRITANSIIEGNWRFNKIREISVDDINYIGINNKYRCLSIFDKKGKRVMLYRWELKTGFIKVVRILKNNHYTIKRILINIIFGKIFY